ncbi:MAG: hypothetical protein IRZ28_11270 [Steroidobacteraceae bacterium]|nr:hypothetical protein [Steroidobacteraceae bacterium]
MSLARHARLLAEDRFLAEQREERARQHAPVSEPERPDQTIRQLNEALARAALKVAEAERARDLAVERLEDALSRLSNVEQQLRRLERGAT